MVNVAKHTIRGSYGLCRGIYQIFGMVLLMVQNSHSQPPFGCFLTIVKWLDICHINRWTPDFWTINRMSMATGRPYFHPFMSWLSQIPWDHKKAMYLSVYQLPIEKWRKHGWFLLYFGGCNDNITQLERGLDHKPWNFRIPKNESTRISWCTPLMSLVALAQL